jgi:hypothetical protein
MRVQDRELLPMSDGAALEPVFASLSGGARPPPDGVDDPDALLPMWPDAPETGPLFLPGERILASARRLAGADDDGGAGGGPAQFARAASYRSLNPAITGAYVDLPKGNVFAGDVLHAAGYAAPTYPLPGGGSHYKEAERWPRESAFFDRITSNDAVRPGDLLVIDYHHRQGASGGAHVEVVTRVDDGGRRVTTMGARAGGVVEDQAFGRRLTAGERAGDHVVFRAPGTFGDSDVYVLRPRSTPVTLGLRG